ncbi:MAG: carboxypeptidase regulatory-like domain-containing protein [Rhodothermales bacterium]
MSRHIGHTLLLLLMWVAPLHAQTAQLSGFVTDAANGQVLDGATVALFTLPDGALTYGTATTGDGIYLLSGIVPGAYRIAVSFVGYETVQDTLIFESSQTRTYTVALSPDAETLTEVLVEAERTSGVARVSAGFQRIRPEEIEAIPAPDVSGDLANYITTLPGVVTTGDRGGQFFIRGGEPSQNLVLLDGMIVYQPFHLLGFYSAFPADVIDRADFYAGGFGTEYAGRLSSVLDVTLRTGNVRRWAGMASASPFASGVRVEGPVIRDQLSVLFSARQSLIHQTGESLYGEALPFDFSDLLGKVHLSAGPRHRFSFTGFQTHDRGDLLSEINSSTPQELYWRNRGGSLRWLLLSKNLPIATQLTVSRSSHEMTQGLRDEPSRHTSVNNTRLALNATFSEGSFFGGRSTTRAGWDAVLSTTENSLDGLFQDLALTDTNVPAFGLYVEPEFVLGDGLRLSSGLRMQWYNVRFRPYLEPRLRFDWAMGQHHLHGAVGLYQQQVIGLNDRRDAASVFTAWTGIPRDELGLQQRLDNQLLHGRIGQSLHLLLGYRQQATNTLEWNVEAFYKHTANLFVGEWTAFPRLSTRLQPATGRSAGFEARVEWRRRPLYAYLTYGLSTTRYAAGSAAIPVWYGTEQLRYRPAHDRRHQINAVAQWLVHGFDVSIRWHFGSGLPYTRPLAFDGFVLIDDVETVFRTEHSRRVIYERPFGSVLPTYHRLDVSVERVFPLGAALLHVQASTINVYDRRNVFYVDIFTLERKDQLPFIPSLGLKVTFGE